MQVPRQDRTSTASPARHHDSSDKPGGDKTGDEDDLVEHTEPTALGGRCHLHHIWRGNRHLAAEADALNEAGTRSASTARQQKRRPGSYSVVDN
jgi:hypothetical protein